MRSHSARRVGGGGGGSESRLPRELVRESDVPSVYYPTGGTGPRTGRKEDETRRCTLARIRGRFSVWASRKALSLSLSLLLSCYHSRLFHSTLSTQCERICACAWCTPSDEMRFPRRLTLDWGRSPWATLGLPPHRSYNVSLVQSLSVFLFLSLALCLSFAPFDGRLRAVGNGRGDERTASAVG